MKKLLSFIACVLTSITMQGHDFEVNGIFYNILSTTSEDPTLKVEVTYEGGSYDAYDEYSGTVVIPETVRYGGNTYTVTRIGSDAFRDCKKLESITISKNISFISSYAFYNCKGLKEIYYDAESCVLSRVSSSAESNWWIFTNAGIESNGITVVIGDNVNTIPDGFLYSTGLVQGDSAPQVIDVSFSSQSKCLSIGKYAFRGLALKAISMPDCVSSIGQYAFQNCSSLNNIVIGKNTTSIGGSAFSGCSSLKKVYNRSDLVITKGSTANGYAGNYADIIYNKYRATSDDGFVCCSDSVLYAYEGDATEITIPANVGGYAINSINSAMFTSRSQITSVTVSDGLLNIPSSAFINCTNLEKFYIQDGSKPLEIGSNIISANAPLNTLYIGRSLTGNVLTNKNIENVEISSSVTALPDNCLAGCTNLKRVQYNSERPYSINANCLPSGVSLYVPQRGLLNFFSAEGWMDIDRIYCQENGRRYFGLYAETIGDYTVKANGQTNPVVIVAEGDNLTISAGSSYVAGNDMVYLNGQDISYQLPYTEKMNRRCTLKEINNSELKTITMTKAGNLLQQLGNISVLPTITSLKLNGNINGTDIKMIRDMENLRYLDLTDANIVEGGSAYYKTYTTQNNAVPQYAFYGLPKLWVLNLPNSATEIGNYAVSADDNLLYTRIGDACKIIRAYAFADSKMLGMSDGGRNLTTISDYAYRNCSNLKIMNLGDKVETIGIEAYYDCVTLDSIHWSAGLKTIGSKAFQNCKSLKYVDLLNNVTTVGTSAFQGCTGITKLNIHENVSSINTYAFADCSNLMSIFNFRETPQTVNANVFQGVDKSVCSLTVPTDSYTEYYLANVWKDFVNLDALDVYYIAYYVDDQLIAKHYYRTGDVIIAPETPAKEGYTLTGWNGIPDVMPARNVTINATFTEDKIVMGDANGDGKVSIGDVVTTVNYVLEKPVPNFVYEAANVDGDSKVDMADVVQIVNIVLGKASMAKGAKASSIASGTMAFGTTTQKEGKLIIPIELSNACEMSAMQMDVRLPEGVNIESVDAGNAHVASWNKLANGNVRIMVYSMDNKTFANNGIANITVSANAAVNTSESIECLNIIECTPSASKFNCMDVSMDMPIITTIHSATNDFKVYAEGRQIVIVSPTEGTVKISSVNGIAKSYSISAGKNVINVNSAGVFVVNNQKIVIK